MRTFMFAAAAVFTLGACSPLTSNHPLFAIADQTGPPPLAEGVWVALNSRCTREAAAMTPLPDDCEPINLHRSADGGWEASGPGKNPGEVETIPLLLVPAVPRAGADAYAPLYVAELSARDSGADRQAPARQRIYALVAPLGAMPAHEAMFSDIDCEAILRQGPLEGVSAQHDDQGKVNGCTTESRAAVLEAARRATIEELNSLNDSRLVFVHE